MAYSKPSKSRKRGQPQYIILYHWIADTDACRTMKPAPRALYLEIKRKYNGHNNGVILLSYQDASKRLNIVYNSVGKWFRELEERGFIVCVQKHHLGPSGVGRTSHWRLTEYDYEGRPPTADFKNWRPDKK